MTRTISMLSGLAVAAMLAAGMAAPAASQAFKSNKAGQRCGDMSLCLNFEKYRTTYPQVQRKALSAGRSGARRSTTAKGVGKLTGNKRAVKVPGIIIYDIQDGFLPPPPKKKSKPDTSKDDCMSCD